MLDGDGGDDRLEGDAGDDKLSDSSGQNRLYGGSGKDELQGGHRRDRLSGGPGNDKVNLGASPIPAVDSDGVADSVRCGSGRDRVFESDPKDFVPPECERALVDYYEVVGRPRRVGAVLRVRCHVLPDYYDGGARVWLFSGKKRIGRSGTVRRSATFTVKLSAAGRRIARSGAIVVIRSRVGYFEGDDGFKLRLP
jgi:Ca2+-binding RTX toxin-like protein